MGIRYRNKAIELSDVLRIDDAEELLALLQKHPAAKIELQACTHVHAACLQVLMAARPGIHAWPQKTRLAHWLQTALN